MFVEWKKFSHGLKEVKRTMKNIQQEAEMVDKSYMLQPLDEHLRLLRNMRVAQPLKA